jgi:DnaJ-class molecular chaperone
MRPLMEKCPICNGQGIVPRERRKMANGEYDPADFRRHDICLKCGGGGQVPTNPRTIEERQPGNLADNIGETG